MISRDDVPRFHPMIDEGICLLGIVFLYIYNIIEIIEA